MNKALNQILELKGQVARVCAMTPHHLFGVNEIESMLLCAEMFFRASLERKESIGWFLREDYPEQSDSLEWIVITSEDGAAKITKKPVPIDSYANKPDIKGGITR